MAKWLSVNAHLKENPLFRVVVDITIGGSDQHLGIVRFDKSPLRLLL